MWDTRWYKSGPEGKFYKGLLIAVPLGILFWVLIIWGIWELLD